MATVYFDKKHTKIVDMFGDSGTDSSKKIFSSNVEFMIFAAMIGRSIYDSCDKVKINKSNHAIKEETFRDKQDIAYLLALDGTKNGEIMRSGNENEIIAAKQWLKHQYQRITLCAFQFLAKNITTDAVLLN